MLSTCHTIGDLKMSYTKNEEMLLQEIAEKLMELYRIDPAAANAFLKEHVFKTGGESD